MTQQLFRQSAAKQQQKTVLPRQAGSAESSSTSASKTRRSVRITSNNSCVNSHVCLWVRKHRWNRKGLKLPAYALLLAVLLHSWSQGKCALISAGFFFLLIISLYELQWKHPLSSAEWEQRELSFKSQLCSALPVCTLPLSGDHNTQISLQTYSVRLCIHRPCSVQSALLPALPQGHLTSFVS